MATIPQQEPAMTSKGPQPWWLPRPSKLLRIRNFRRGLLLALLGFLCLDLLFPLPPAKDFSTQVIARDGSLLGAYLSNDDKWRLETKTTEVPPLLVDALVAKEDRWFWCHPGFNPFSIIRAAVGNLWTGNRTSGASTITMQVARMLEPKPRTLVGKVQEAFRAMQLEWHYDKHEILEMYMSYLPYGGNVEGVQAASFLYFQRPPRQLSPSQCLLLTVIPNRPNSLRPDLAPEAARQARNRWLHRLESEGVIDQAQLATAIAEPVPRQRHSLPILAPQFCHAARGLGKSRRIQTTLDPRTQHTSQELLQRHVRQLKAGGITNGAIMVVDNRTMDVLAYCGSADFEDKAAHGEVDAINAVRAPGSTLKPFIYAMAFDMGLLTPRMKVLDIPKEYSDFNPVNYDRNFRGEVEAGDALRHSLNLPAVRLLHAVGLRRFVAQLRKAGFASVDRNRRELGLSLALGGCGATLHELVRAYAALANGGILRPIRFLQGDGDTHTGQAMCSPEAAYMVSEILSGIQRPDLPTVFIGQSKRPLVAWKTGTSFGRRDAWAIGYNPRYTIGVWMGNMDGKPVLEMSGATTAVPLLLELFNAIDYDASKQWLQPPPRLRQRLVCTDTGLPPSHDCKHLARDHYIPGVSPSKPCARYRTLFTDSAGTVQYCTACLPAQGYVRQQYPVYSAEYALWLADNNRVHSTPPPHFERCTAIFAGAGPAIHSPVTGQTYYLIDGSELMLQAEPDPLVNQHFWFVNGHFVGNCPAGGKLFFKPRNGDSQVLCLDDKGRQRSMMLRVEVL